MKKLFLLALATASTASMVAQDEYTNNIGDKYKEGYHLEVVWANTDMCGDASVRQGNGTNDKFYLNDFSGERVRVFTRKGESAALTLPGNYLWLGNMIDRANHVVVRASPKSWAKATEWNGPEADNYAGCFYPNGSGSMFYVLDSNTDQWLNTEPLVLDCGVAMRFDAIGQVAYDVTADVNYNWSIMTPAATGQEFFFSDLTRCTGTKQFRTGIATEFGGTAAATAQTLGSAMYYGEMGTDISEPATYGRFMNAAVYANPHIDVTYPGKFANGIRRYTFESTTEYDEELDEEVTTWNWQAQREFFITPQHSNIGGFYVFSLAGKDYIVYPGGNTINAGDAIGISEVAFADTPVDDATLDVSQLVARSFGAADDAGNPRYLAKTNYMNLNVEPVDGEPNAVHIYCFTSGGPMVKFKFSVGEGAGIDNVAVDNNADAPVEYYGIDGTRVANPRSGNIYIRKQGTSVAKVVY